MNPNRSEIEMYRLSETKTEIDRTIGQDKIVRRKEKGEKITHFIFVKMNTVSSPRCSGKIIIPKNTIMYSTSNFVVLLQKLYCSSNYTTLYNLFNGVIRNIFMTLDIKIN